MQAPATEGEALFREVLESPEDDTPRLIHADWLEEVGNDPLQAELIRLQIRDKDARPSQREQEILTVGYGMTWLYELSMRERWSRWGIRGRQFRGCYLSRQWAVNWSRGFVTSISLDLDAFMVFAERIFSRQPLHKVMIADARPENPPGQPPQWIRSVPPVTWRRNHGPSELMDIMLKECGGCPEATVLPFSNHEDAMRLLHRACFLYGRQCAGLTPGPPGSPSFVLDPDGHVKTQESIPTT